MASLQIIFFQRHVASLLFLFTSLVFCFHSAYAHNEGGEEKKLSVSGTVHWTGTGIGKSHPGTLNVKSGEITLRGKDIVSGKFVIDMKSLDTPDGRRLKNHLKSADFFEVETYPEASFVITQAQTLPSPGPNGETHSLTGDLTIKNNKHSISFQAKVEKDGETYKATAETAIEDRTQFGINYNSGRLLDPVALGDRLIHDKIQIRLDLQAK